MTHLAGTCLVRLGYTSSEPHACEKDGLPATRPSTMIGSMSEPLELYRTAVIGMPISHVWRGHGSALFIELGALAPRTSRDGSAGEPQGEAGVMIEWSWRIEDGPSIACGSWSDENLWSPTFARLIGSIVEDVRPLAVCRR